MKKMNELTAIGLTCGVGSLLIGARSAGFKVVGNIEWRKYYHTGTFEKNFPNAFMVKSIDEVPVGRSIGRITLAMGHPECGAYSMLSSTPFNRYSHEDQMKRKTDKGDIPIFVQLVKRTDPEFFVMDNLPGSLLAVDILEYRRELPGYDLFPEWVSNYNYGNVQKNRRRFFLIGAKREQKFVFRSGEFYSTKTLRDTIGDLPSEKDIVAMNHVHRMEDEVIRGWSDYHLGIRTKTGKVTFRQFKKFLRSQSGGGIIEYPNRKGELKKKIGSSILKLDRPAHVLTGGGFAGIDQLFREDTLQPLTLRERARIQGCPDDFIFLPIQDPGERTSVIDNYHTKQVGKFMPVEFATYISRSIKDHLAGRTNRDFRERIANHNPVIDGAKMRLCEHDGRRPEICAACWIKKCTLR